jgi:hypothetical protein
MNKADSEARLVHLWLERPVDKRTMIDLLAFSGWVKENHPQLFHRMTGDPYQQLKSVLRFYIRDSTR